MANENKTTLFELVGDYLRLYEMADDPDTDPLAFFDTMEGIEGEIEDKADGYACVIAKLNGEAKAIKEQEERLCKRRKAIESNIKYMKDVLQDAMEETGKTKFKTTLFSFGIQNNPASVVLDTDIYSIPDKFIKYAEPEVNKTLLKEALNAGEDLKGIAHLEQTRGLRIR